jgi:ankyrin repeat protein
MLRKLVCFIILLVFSSFWPSEIYAKSIFDANQSIKLFEAVFTLDVNGVQQALKAGANPNVPIRSRSAVEIAMISLPSLKGEIFKKDEDKKWIREKEKKCIEVLKKLFNAGARVKQSYLRWPIERNSVLILKLLLQRGLDPNSSIGELTPIELAVKCNSQDVVDFLIEQGVKPVSPQVAAQLSLIDAAQNHDIIRMERSLREGAKLNCVFRGNRISALLTAVSNYISGFEGESYGAVVYLLQKGANPNFEGPNGNTPLHLAMQATKIYSGNSADMFTAKKTYRLLSLQALVKAGANVSSRNDKGKTPLHVAAAWDNLLGAKFLVENGANINLKDQDGKTPFDYTESAEIIKLLKSHGAKEQ